MASAPDIAVILTNPSREIQWVNDGFTEITGYSMPEVLGKKPSILQGPETEPEIVLRIRAQLENQLPCKEVITNYRKNGEKYPCKLVIYPIFDSKGKLQNFIAFEIDGERSDDSTLPILQLKKRYDQSTLRGTTAVSIYGALCDLFEREELYKDPDISMPGIAKKIHTNTNYLSQVVNQFSNQNFQQFVNSYRIKAFQKKLRNQKGRQSSFFELAREFGFRNKSTFYKVYKQHTGKTPSAYLRDLKK